MRFVFILTIGLTINSRGQTQEKECACPSNQYADSKPETTFHFTNGKDIALCGYSETKGSEKIYSEFVLAVCGQDKILDFWDAMTSCKIRVTGDTLIIDELKYLPTGDDLNFKSTLWTSQKVYFKNNEVQRRIKVNRGIRKYSRLEIDRVIKEFEHAERYVEGLADKLFMATLSGDKKARQYFIDYKTKFGPLDGYVAEDYNELTAMLKVWDNA